MKSKKVLSSMAIILSMMMLMMDMYLYMKMKFNWAEMGSNHHQYENASLMMLALFSFGTLMWGILLMPMVWLEYSLMNLLMKIYNKFNSLSSLFLCLMMLVVMATMLILFMSMMMLIIMTLV